MKEKVYVSGPMNFTRTALENLTKPLAVLLLFLGLLNIFIASAVKPLALAMGI